MSSPSQPSSSSSNGTSSTTDNQNHPHRLLDVLQRFQDRSLSTGNSNSNKRSRQSTATAAATAAAAAQQRISELAPIVLSSAAARSAKRLKTRETATTTPATATAAKNNNNNNNSNNKDNEGNEGGTAELQRLIVLKERQQDDLDRQELVWTQVLQEIVNVWGVYRYGLRTIAGLGDLGEAPDAIMPGNTT